MKTVHVLSVALGLFLIGCLVSVPTATAGNYGCGSHYFQSYGTVGAYQYLSYPAYYSPTYYAPPVSQTCYQTPAGTVCNNNSYAPNVYNTPVETFYRVAPDLAQAKIAQEVAAETMRQFKAEMASQEKEKADRDFKASVLQLLSAQQANAAAGGGNAQAVAQLQAENEQLKGLLAKATQSLEQLAKGPPAIPPGSPSPAPASPEPSHPAPAAGNGPQLPAELKGKPPVEIVKWATGNYCMPCHNQPPRLNLSDPSKLYYEDIADCVNRIISDDPAFVMPKPASGKGHVPIEVLGAFHKLSQGAPHRPAAQK